MHYIIYLFYILNTVSSVEKQKPSPCETLVLTLSVNLQKPVSDAFIDEVTKSPDFGPAVRNLIQILGGEKPFIEWFYSRTGYFSAYVRKNADIFKKALSVEELLEYRPDWNIWRLKEKYSESHGNNNFTFGEIPPEFGNRDDFYSLVTAIRSGLRGQIQLGNGKKYQVTALRNGLSGKTNFKIEIQNGKNTHVYVLKLDPHNPDDGNEVAKENRVLKSDSPFLNAAIDFYLNKNEKTKHRHSTTMYFYDYYNNTALYEYQYGRPLTLDGQSPQAHIVEINKMLRRINQLGIFYNDVDDSGHTHVSDNFIVVTENGRDVIKIVDSGEASFVNTLKPGCTGYHTDLPNLNGQSPVRVMAGMMFAIIHNFSH